MQPTDNSISHVVILGGGTAGWMAAAALAKGLNGQPTRITVIESEDIGIVGVGEATVPSIHAFNTLLGLSTNAFMQRCQATIKLGISFVDWGRKGQRYMHAFSPYGAGPQGAQFHRLWPKFAHEARARGETPDIDRYNIGAVAAFSGRFGRSTDVPLNHAYHFDAALYGQYLRDYATQRGVTRIEGRVVSVAQNAETGFIEALSLQSGDVISGDFFIDCSGFTGVLIEGALKTGYDSWAHWLPCDRAIAVPSELTDGIVPYTRSTAQDAGWIWRIPLQHRAGNGYVYASSYISDDAAEARLLAQLDGPAVAAPRRLRFTAGKRKQVWNRNCLALGLAAGFLEPLESTSIHLIQTSIFRLLSLFPDKDFNAAEIAEFNRQTSDEYENVRDFLIAHYKLGQRDERFWTACADMPVPDRVSDILALFAANGRLTLRPEHLFSTNSWLAVLLGQGGLPAGYDPLLRPMPSGELADRIQAMRRHIDAVVRALPAYAPEATHVSAG